MARKGFRMSEEQKAKLSGENAHKWRGEKVGYSRLHKWVRENKGHPTQCSKCGKCDANPRKMHWANVDRKYRRVLSDFIGMCVSCHQQHDRNLIRKGSLV